MEMIEHMTFSRRYRRRPGPDQELHHTGEMASPVYHPQARVRVAWMIRGGPAVAGRDKRRSLPALLGGVPLAAPRYAPYRVIRPG